MHNLKFNSGLTKVSLRAFFSPNGEVALAVDVEYDVSSLWSPETEQQTAPATNPIFYGEAPEMILLLTDEADLWPVSWFG